MYKEKRKSGNVDMAAIYVLPSLLEVARFGNKKRGKERGEASPEGLCANLTMKFIEYSFSRTHRVARFRFNSFKSASAEHHSLGSTN